MVKKDGNEERQKLPDSEQPLKVVPLSPAKNKTITTTKQGPPAVGSTHVQHIIGRALLAPAAAPTTSLVRRPDVSTVRMDTRWSCPQRQSETPRRPAARTTTAHPLKPSKSTAQSGSCMGKLKSSFALLSAYQESSAKAAPLPDTAAFGLWAE